MIAKVLILCTVVVAVSCSGLIGTGVSAGSRVMDGHGNYAFEYGISSAGANRRRSEVGSGWAGPVKTSYAVADSHIAPAWGHGGYGLGAVGYGGYGLGRGGIGLGLGLGRGGIGLGLGLGGIGLGRAGLGHAGLGCAGLGCGVGYAGVGKLI